MWGEPGATRASAGSRRRAIRARLGIQAALLAALVATSASAEGPSPELQQRFETFTRDVCGGAGGELANACTELEGPPRPFGGTIFQATFNVPSTLASLFGVSMCGVDCQVTCTVSRCMVSDQLGYFVPLDVPNPGLGNAPPPEPGQVEIGAATRDLIPDEVTVLGPSATRTARTHTDVLRSRGAAVRSGESGVDISGLDLRDSTGHLVLGSELQQSYEEWSHAASGDALDERIGAWANGFGEFGEFDGRGDEPAFDFDEAGFLVGADYRVGEQTVIGAAFGWSDGELDFPGNSGDLDKETFSGSLYATTQLGPVYLDGAATFHHLDFDLKRRIRLPFLLQTARGSTDAQLWAISAGAGTEWNLGALSVGPHLRVEYLDLTIDGFSERGAGAVGFRFDGQDAESLQTLLGIDVRYAISTSLGILSPYARVDYVHEWLDDSRGVGASFLGDPSRTRFTLRVSSPDRNFAVAGGGLALTLAGGHALFVDFESPIGLRDTEHYSFTAGARLAF